MLSIIDSNGVERWLGNNISYAPRMKWPVYGDVPNTPMVPRSQWKPVDLRSWTPKVVKDQDGIGACNAFATCTAMECCRKQLGLKHVPLSCGWLYGNINGQQDQGSMLEDALEWVMSKGVCPASVVGELEWQRNQWPANAAEEAKPYRMLEAFWCPTFDHLASAALAGFFLNLGIMWGDNFTPDRDGWLPASPRGGGGHSIVGCGLAERNGRWGMWMKNSWGPGWGIDGGYAIIPEEGFRGPVGGWWACRSVVTEDAGDLPAPRTA